MTLAIHQFVFLNMHNEVDSVVFLFKQAQNHCVACAVWGRAIANLIASFKRLAPMVPANLDMNFICHGSIVVQKFQSGINVTIKYMS